MDFEQLFKNYRNLDESNVASYECQKCGAQISQYMTNTHDKFHYSLTQPEGSDERCQF